MTTSLKDDFKKRFNVPDDIFAKLELYHALLLKWQKAINLVGPATLGEAWYRHFLDSAQLLPRIPAHAKIHADIGSGGGFPGLVLAIMASFPETHLIESDARKSAFLRTVARETETRVIIHTQRIENMTGVITPDFITARAVSPLETLLDWSLPWAVQNPDITLCFMKGAQAHDEIAAARQKFSFAYEAVSSITDPDAKILSIQGLSRMP